MKISILGTKYNLQMVPPEHPLLKQGGLRLDGLCDWSNKTILVSDCSDLDFANIGDYIKQVKRHEIIHAFLNESGLAESWEHKHHGHEETMVDWIALQFPKMVQAFKAADAL